MRHCLLSLPHLRQRDRQSRDQRSRRRNVCLQRQLRLHVHRMGGSRLLLHQGQCSVADSPWNPARASGRYVDRLVLDALLSTMAGHEGPRRRSTRSAPEAPRRHSRPRRRLLRQGVPPNPGPEPDREGQQTRSHRDLQEAIIPETHVPRPDLHGLLPIHRHHPTPELPGPDLPQARLLQRLQPGPDRRLGNSGLHIRHHRKSDHRPNRPSPAPVRRLQLHDPRRHPARRPLGKFRSDRQRQLRLGQSSHLRHVLLRFWVQRLHEHLLARLLR